MYQRTFFKTYSIWPEIFFDKSQFFIDVCSIRLDFDNFVLESPSDQTAAGNDGGRCLTDSLSFTTSAGNTYPTICGINTGYHGIRETLHMGCICCQMF